MPRKVRVEFPGALYHIYNRGNYRSPIFETSGAAGSFEESTFEAAKRYGWLLQAYTIQINHFHYALETPAANLSTGMHWLLSTHAIRFNRFRDERGHLFEGRFHAKLVEPASSYLTNLVNYIHLNPVEAGIVPVERAADFRWGSLRRFVRGNRPPCLVCKGWLEDMGGLKDTAAGWKSYQDYLKWSVADEGEQKRRAAEVMCRGWALGSQAWQAEIAAAQAKQLAEVDFRRGEIGEVKEAVWSRALDALLLNAGRTRADAERDKCAAPWKVEIAGQLRLTTTASNTWIAGALHMGSRNSVSVYLSRSRGKIK